MPDPPREGETHVHERTFTREDVRQFTGVSGDAQPIHTEPDEEGRLVVQGLLTASLATKIGGDREVLATRMEFEFRRPVYTGETIVCEWITETVEERADCHALTATVTCRRDGTVVLAGEVEGIVRTGG